MQKIISLFKRDYEGNRQVINEITPGAEWVLAGEGVATEKVDGTCCLIKDWQLYKRYDAKKGKTPPKGFIPAQPDPDPVTGHWPGWLLVGDGPDDQWHREAWGHFMGSLTNGTYELTGPKVQGNPYNLAVHSLTIHGKYLIKPEPPRDFQGLKDWFSSNQIEGIVWHHPDGRMVKIKRKDFGYKWPAPAEISAAVSQHGAGAGADSPSSPV